MALLCKSQFKGWICMYRYTHTAKSIINYHAGHILLTKTLLLPLNCRDKNVPQQWDTWLRTSFSLSAFCHWAFKRQSPLILNGTVGSGYWYIWIDRYQTVTFRVWYVEKLVHLYFSINMKEEAGNDVLNRPIRLVHHVGSRRFRLSCINTLMMMMTRPIRNQAATCFI